MGGQPGHDSRGGLIDGYGVVGGSDECPRRQWPANRRQAVEHCFWNDHALRTFRVCWKNGDKPSVGIWTGRGEHGFEDESVGSFRNWVEFALGRRSLAEYETKVMEGWEFPHTEFPRG